ncbi:rna-directed dna polymerase from mobile element jockey-like protein [Lasius niger]|uniref:Rna-directed dna polymerase from mobile element jockey-like protein n=1 Tax=Lasius niger TaxID=67767 RepID=A0A0J7KCH4_LASNI|nr:rna-directed dna polymerase from mobile element jockey-like protein [Lasius niger]
MPNFIKGLYHVQEHGKEDQFIEVFSKFGPRFIIDGDFNAKHTVWGSRLITPKGRELLKDINAERCDFVSSCKPTYWPADKEKVPDLIDFFIMKGISNIYLEVDNVDDLTSDYVPVMMTISSTLIKKKKRQVLTNKFTKWDKFREELDGLIDLKVRLKTTNELDVQAQNLVDAMHRAAKILTPTSKNTMKPDRQKYFNKINNQLNRLIKDMNNKNLEEYLGNLTTDDDTNYSLWKATRKFKRPATRVPPLKDEFGEWVRCDVEKANVFARHLARVFQPHDVQSNVALIKIYKDNSQIKYITSLEVAQEIDNNINLKKALGIDEMSPRVLKELSRKAKRVTLHELHSSREFFQIIAEKQADAELMHAEAAKAQAAASEMHAHAMTEIASAVQKLADTAAIQADNEKERIQIFDKLVTILNPSLPENTNNE